MKKFVATLLAFFGITCCVTASYAATPRVGIRLPDLAPAGFPAQVSTLSLVGPAEKQPDVLPVESRSDSKFDYSRLAYKISYAGAILLTADHVIRSVDSLLDSMEYTRPDGTTVHFIMEPKSKGFEVMVKMSRPLGF
jgi:hypothetical protein